jgi:hypothetical protein
LAWLNLKILIGAKFISLRHTSSCLRDETTEMKVLGPDLITCKFSTVLDETPFWRDHSSTPYLTPADEPISTILQYAVLVANHCSKLPSQWSYHSL